VNSMHGMRKRRRGNKLNVANYLAHLEEADEVMRAINAQYYDELPVDGWPPPLRRSGPSSGFIAPRPPPPPRPLTDDEEREYRRICNEYERERDY
jgi:hypothetical protein